MYGHYTDNEPVKTVQGKRKLERINRQDVKVFTDTFELLM